VAATELTRFPGRREVKRLTGNYKVPTLVLDNVTIIDGSQNIIEWAGSNEAAGLRESPGSDPGGPPRNRRFAWKAAD
jgi:hypothetical protein